MRRCFLSDLAVVFDAGKIGAENEAVLLIEVAVNEDRKAVSVFKISISATVGDNDALGFVS